MKKLFILLPVILMFGICYGQAKKDNTIIIHGFVSYSQLKSILFDEGFIPTNSDTSFISTNYKEMGWMGAVGYMIKRTDSTVIFKGIVYDVTNGNATPKWTLENTGEKVSVFRVGFANMSKIATSFRLPVTYLRIKQ